MNEIYKQGDGISPRKKPKQARSTETVDVILSAAAHILETSGLREYTTNSIASRAGVSIGSVYQYFPSKDAITAALIGKETGAIAEELKEIAVSERDWQESLEAMSELAAKHQLKSPNLARILDGEEARLKVLGDSETIQEHIERVLNKGIPGQNRDELQCLAKDIIAITKALTDSTRHDTTNSGESLQIRLRSAVIGYVNEMQNQRSQVKPNK